MGCLIFFCQGDPQFIQSTHQSNTCRKFNDFFFCKMQEQFLFDFAPISIVVGDSFCPA